MSNNRVGYFDIFRGFGIVFMVMGHVVFGEVFDKYIHAFHMPMFFFVTGFFCNPDKYDNMRKFVLQKLKTLIIPYTVFVLVCQVLHYLYTNEYSFSYFIISYFTPNNNRIDVAGALWFLECLFTAEILFYIILRIIKNNWVRMVTITVVSLSANLIHTDLPFCLDSAMSCLLVMYLGYMAKKYSINKQIEKVWDLNILCLVVLFIMNTALILVNGNVNIRTNYYSIVPLTWVNCIGAIIIYINISKRLDSSTSVFIKKLNVILKYFGKNSLVYLVLNEIFIYLATCIVSFCGLSGMANSRIWYNIHQAMIFVISMGLLSLATEVFNRTRLKALLGKFKTDNHNRNAELLYREEGYNECFGVPKYSNDEDWIF